MHKKNLNLSGIFFIIICFLSIRSYSFEQTKIENIEEYLNSINNMIANFIQIAPDGEESSGKFFLSRPGKIRWQYNPPVPTLIIVNDKHVSHYDYDLNQVSYGNAEDNLGSLLARKQIKFGNEIIVKNLEERYGNISITIYKKGKEKEGEIEITFKSNPLLIKKLDITDSLGKRTSVMLENVQNVISLDKSLFVLKNPKYFKNERL